MKRILYVIICLALVSQSCKQKTKTPSKEFHSNDFDWTITIPENFDTISAVQWAKMQNKGLEAVEKTYDQKVDNQAKTIFVFKSDQLNFFESNYQPYDSTADGSYAESTESVKEIMYQTFVTQMPGVKVDSSTSIEKIDNLDFHKLSMKITYPNAMVMNAFLFTRIFDKKEFSVNIMYVDAKKGEQMLNAWKTSKFGQSK